MCEMHSENSLAVARVLTGRTSISLRSFEFVLSRKWVMNHSNVFHTANLPLRPCARGEQHLGRFSRRCERRPSSGNGREYERGKFGRRVRLGEAGGTIPFAYFNTIVCDAAVCCVVLCFWCVSPLGLFGSVPNGMTANELNSLRCMPCFFRVRWLSEEKVVVRTLKQCSVHEKIAHQYHFGKLTSGVRFCMTFLAEMSVDRKRHRCK